MDYPSAHRLDLVDVLHGTEVADPYRWLEDPDAPETKAWSEAQDKLAREVLDHLPGREAFRERLRELLAAGLATVPEVRGRRAFFTRRGPGQEHAVLLVREGDAERVLIDPSTLSDDDTVTLDGWVPSIEGDRLAFWLSQGGDEEASLSVMDVASGAVIDGPIDRTRYCPLAWLPGGERFYYGRRLPASAVPEGEDRFHRRIWLHLVGTDPDGDELVFGEGRDKTEYHLLDISADGRWLLVGAALGTAPRNDLYIADLAGDGTFRPVQEATDATTYGLVGHDGRLYLRTNLDAARFRIVVADPAEPGPESWRDLVGEGEEVIEDFALTRDALLVAGTRHAVGRVTVHDLADGSVRGEVGLPGLGSIRGISAPPDGGDRAWIGWTDFTTPPRVYRYAVASGTLELWMDAPGQAETKGVVARQEVYRSADGTEVRMFVLHREGLTPDRARPTVLYGYGGFNIALTPEYSASILAWVERGGVYAIANLRGGSEEGEAWHRAGMREHKQHVFDDFAAAAERLVELGWTSPEHLGISGGSNGGLLVGAALTQRPELWAAVVCSAPLLDMVRYERFGLGETLNDEYGRADEETEFGWLYGYSPYHHVTRGTRYPAVLFTVFESDTRVDPLHARKLCAALQWATAGGGPILLRREVSVGHGARSVSRTIDLAVDASSFLAAELRLHAPAE
ncbi:MAG TPA: prolyl oligopeptidase family serine peptidase [Actinomycetota bacterium]|nr:prolyl oligopeptidase family serine peptidase [Actinomycetota bacterium]